MPVKPNFLVIGAQKSGTTWLSENISAHPDVFCPEKKEIEFFFKHKSYQRGLKWYLDFFANYSNQTAVGEVTANYFWTSDNKFDCEESKKVKNIPQLIHDSFPNIKLILSLRNPVKRAISAYHHHINAGRISPNTSILEAMKSYGILNMGYYDIHLKNYLKYFDENQVLVLIFEEDIIGNKKKTLKRIFDFIGVENTYLPKSLYAKQNVKKGSLFIRINYYFPLLGKILKRIPSDFILQSNMLPIEVTKREKLTLKQIYRPHIENLSQILNRKLPWTY